MPDMTEFEQANIPSKPKSKVDIILNELAGTERHEALTAALHDRSYNCAGIARVLRSWGYDISQDAIQKWRRRK